MEENRYKCNICKKFYKSYKSLWKHNYTYHKNDVVIQEKNVVKSVAENVVKCNTVIQDGVIKKDNSVCKYCNKKLVDRTSRWKHEQICKIKDKKNLENINKKVLDINNNTLKNSNLSINAGIINDNKQITINNFGNDNLDYITDKFKNNLMKHFLFEEEFTEPIPKLIQNINFNEKHKENNNVKITNMRSKTGQKYIDKKWVHASKEALLEELFAFGDKCIQKFLDEMDHIPLNIQDGFDEFQGRKDSLKDFIKKEIELISYVYCKNRDNELDV